MHIRSVDAFASDPVAARQLTALLDLVTDAVLAVSDTWRVVHVNARAQRAFDVRREHLVGRDLWQAWPHAAGSRLFTECHRAARDQVAVEFQHFFEHVNRWFAIRAEPIQGGLALFARDLTESKRAHQALQEAEERFALAAGAVNDGIWDYNALANTNWWSPRCYELLGYDPGEIDMSVESLKQLVHPDDQAGLWRAMQDHVDRRTSFYEHEFRARHKDGDYRWFHSRGLAVRDEHGRVIRMVGSQSDVTRRKDAEAATALGESRLRLALSAAKMVAWETDLATGWTTMSDGAEEMWGARRASREDMSNLIHPDDLPRVRDAWDQAIAAAGEFSTEFRVARPRGVRWYSSRGQVGHGPDGKPDRVHGVFIDVTAHHDAAEALSNAKETAEAANRAKDQFLAVLSHELRTPLTPVLMAAAALEAEDGLSAEAREDLSMIRRNIELETRLIDDLLDLSRIINGKMTLHTEDVPLNALLRTVGQMVEADVTTKGLWVAWELAADVDLVRGDSARLQQVLWNLLKNAVKFTPQGGRVRVRSFNPAPRRIRIEVTDSGIGIDSTMLHRIFSAFDQGEAGINRSFGGLGLGLAISKAIADMHGASLGARSDGKGCGATFWLEMSNDGIPELLSNNLDLPAGAIVPKPTRVLLVEDHPDTRNTLQRLLQMTGYTVASAGTMADGLALAGAGGFDVVVSDIDLPDGTGWELISQLRSRQDLLPAIAVSGFGMEDDVRRSTEAGFAHHLTKPVNIKQLQAAIGSLVQIRATRALQLPPV